MSDANNLDTIPCNECQAGQMHRKFLAYFTWLGNDLVTVPDFPSWVCDVCGRREYDVHALNRLTLLLAENAGKTHAPNFWGREFYTGLCGTVANRIRPSPSALTRVTRPLPEGEEADSFSLPGRRPG